MTSFVDELTCFLLNANEIYVRRQHKEIDFVWCCQRFAEVCEAAERRAKNLEGLPALVAALKRS